MPGKQKRQWKLDDPKADEVDHGRGKRISRPVESVYDHQAVGIDDIAKADDPQAVGTVPDHHRVATENTHKMRGKEQEYHRDPAQKKHIEIGRSPDRLLCPLRLLGAQVLPYQRRSSRTQTPGRQNGEDHNPDGDRIARGGGAAKGLNQAHHAYPTRGGHGKLERAVAGNAQDIGHDFEVESAVLTVDYNAPPASPQNVEGEKDAHATANAGRNGRTGDSQFRKWTQSQNQTGIQAEVD